MKKTMTIAAASIALVAGANAATVFTSGEIIATADTSFGVDTVATLTSGVITAEDGLATFQVSFDITPTAGTQIVSNSNGFWGIDDADISGSEAVASISNIQVVNFNANGGLGTVGDVTGLSFDFVSYTGASGGTDSGFFTAGGNTGTFIDGNAGSDFIGHVSGGNGVGGVQLIGDNTNSLSGVSSVTSFTLGAANASTAWRIDHITVTGVTDIAAVPEPSSTALLGLGGLALILRRRK